MSELKILKQDVITARNNFLESVKELTINQGYFKPSTDFWSAAEITEHLYHAEFGGISSMWKALEGQKAGNPTWKEKHFNAGLTIEEVVEKTWKPKESVPAGAEPRIGGPIIFWRYALESCQYHLDKLTESLEGHNLDTIIYPHPISGPLDVRQRYEFLRFHMDRHKNQVDKLKHHPDFPSM
ncbi:MAG: DinB family protein [Ignavibacteriaceae bacterium]